MDPRVGVLCCLPHSYLWLILIPYAGRIHEVILLPRLVLTSVTQMALSGSFSARRLWTVTDWGG